MTFENIFKKLNRLLPGKLTMVRELKIMNESDFDMIVYDPSTEWNNIKFVSILEKNKHYMFRVHSEPLDETTVLVQVRDMY